MDANYFDRGSDSLLTDRALIENKTERSIGSLSAPVKKPGASKGSRIRRLLVEQWAERLPTMQPAKDLFDKGVRIHLELGENRTRMPLAVIQQVVTRKDQNGKVWGAQQAIDRKTALLLSTRRAADFIDRTQTIGSIEPGKSADLVILGGDFLAVPDDQIASIPVEMTMVGGTVVYERRSPKPGSAQNPK